MTAKIKSFSWNEFSSDNYCFESKQFLTVLLFSHSGGSLNKTDYKSLLHFKTKGIFQES